MMTKRWSTRRARTGHLVIAGAALGAMSLSALSVTAAGASTSKTVVVSTMNGSHGKVLVDNGKTVYTLTSNGTACDSSCLKIWPAVTLPAHVKSAKAGSGVAKSKLGVTTGMGGVHQVTYNGKPLYWFSGDTAKGQVNGNITDQWGAWTAVVLKPATSTSSGSSTTNAGSSSGSGSGSGSGSNGGSGGANAGSGGPSF
jgi:predicted lipoprotein with Yx(FWY)xxD motif